MLFSLKYLRHLANLDQTISNQSIIATINNLGFEVEKIQEMPKVSGLKFGQIKKIYKNPQGDKLTVCEIDFFDKKRIIQTTATNLAQDDLVIAFVPGSMLDNQEFKAKKLQGIESEGMLASWSEMGFNHQLFRDSDVSGIATYNQWQVGDLALDPIKFLELNDTIIEVKILPNRVDANSYYGMARELSAFFETKIRHFKSQQPTLKSQFEVKSNPFGHTTLIEAQNDFKISWQEQLLLNKSGIKAVNDIVDLTNLTLIMTGQPVCAYDQASLQSPLSIKIIDSQKAMITNQSIVLKHNLVIEDQNQTIGLAGIGPLDNFQVTDNTQKFILELSQFDSFQVRNNLRIKNQISHSSLQASKLTTPNLIIWAYNYLSSRLGTFANPVNLPVLQTLSIPYDLEIVNQLAGFKINQSPRYENVMNQLKLLDFDFFANNVVVPFFRADVKTIQDICEEIFRFYGYDYFPLVQPHILNQKITPSQNLKSHLQARGFQEIITYTLVSQVKNNFNPFEFDQTLVLNNPLSLHHQVLRQSLTTSMLEIVNYHLQWNFERFSFFEMGQINQNTQSLAIVSTTKSFAEFKQIVVDICGQDLIFKRSQDDYLHPNLHAIVWQKGNVIAWIGQLNPKIFNHNVWWAEIKLDLLSFSRPWIKTQPFDENPLKSRDITISLQPHQEIKTTIEKINQVMGIVDVWIIDKFFKNEITNVTIRIVGSNHSIQTIDEIFNQ